MSSHDPGGQAGSGPGVDNGYNGSGPENPDIEDLLKKLGALEETVDEPHERKKVQQTISLVERMPGSKAFTRRISRYTTRDMAQSFVGAIVFALPLLVEDGVFEIADWFLEVFVGPIPVFFVMNAVFVVGMTYGLIYYADFRHVEITKPIFGLFPRRLVGVLGISFLTAFLMMFMWGRLHSEGPTAIQQFSRITVIWAAAAFGAALGDILPGESTGTDINEKIGDLIDRERKER